MKKKQVTAERRARRVRARVRGTAERPRLSVIRSEKHIRAQVIDDAKGRTLAAAADQDVDAKGTPVEKAQAVGKLLAERALAQGIKAVAFDRGSRRYHGRVAALADGAREGGLQL